MYKFVYRWAAIFHANNKLSNNIPGYAYGPGTSIELPIKLVVVVIAHD